MYCNEKGKRREKKEKGRIETLEICVALKKGTDLARLKRREKTKRKGRLETLENGVVL